ncbi:Nicotinate-nucleotide--dimethylbenzimidazole phosphoribosyltransferase [Pseudoalteromonas luteoviolacea B = ATCC 29581]|nr:Nicotinate-nucleotide--dimethylbenzimidazole phosphoribosyltransferase [Pseudoalteromonas luteoviolacea B = ATCC 29581]
MDFRQHFSVPKLNRTHEHAVQTHLDSKTKPLGALGQLETLAKQLALVLTDSRSQKIHLEAPTMIVFAGDHGIAREGVSIAPSEVTTQMVANFAHGGAAINAFCRTLSWHLTVVDCGILKEPAKELNVYSSRLGESTAPFHLESAMTAAQVELGLANVSELIDKFVMNGTNVFAFGEMGIGNTSSAAAIYCAITGRSVDETVGRGTGVSDDIVMKKKKLIRQALTLHGSYLASPIEILRRLGGFEIVHLVGAMLRASVHQKIVIVDGFIATAAAMLAVKIEPNVKDYLVFAHTSDEAAHKTMLADLGVEALLNLSLRLGEGTGAALALPLIQCAAAFYNDMASFSEAKVLEVNE